MAQRCNTASRPPRRAAPVTEGGTARHAAPDQYVRLAGPNGSTVVVLADLADALRARGYVDA